jgi:N-methylhydantoinase B
MTTPMDPFTYEIVRHRLLTINDEAATIMAQASGSPVASEAFDFNCGLLDAKGNVILAGYYLVAHAAAMDYAVKYILAEYAVNPGIGPGDMFVTNNPYLGAMHQPDVAALAPIFVQDELVAWCGSVVHHSDVGGPVAGGITVGASSIYEEAIPMAPIRMVEGGIIRKDLEAEFLIRSRTPALNQLDLRGQISSNKIHTQRFIELCELYGTETIQACIEHLVSSTALRFQERLGELPDGVWRHTTFIDHDGVEDAVYKVALTLTKRGDRVRFDFTESDDQAPGLINCSVGPLRGYTLGVLMPLVCYDMPWVPAALWPSVELVSREGSLVDALWPAGVSQGNSSAGHAARTSVNICVSMMLDASAELVRHSLASCMSSYAGQNISGRYANGRQFGSMIIDSLAGGGGARSFADGPGTAGVVNAPASSISDVETNEYNYPLLYLWRRELTDSGGAGRFRGGVGGEHAYRLYGSGGPIECTMFGGGVEQPASAGLCGGEPGQPNGYQIVRDVADWSRINHGDLSGAAVEYLAPKSRSRIGENDVYIMQYGGGGGFGDPLSRPPEEVLADVRRGVVGVQDAKLRYFVDIAGATHESYSLIGESTEGLRTIERARRLGGRAPKREPTFSLTPGRRLASWLNCDQGRYLCAHCQGVLGDVDDNVRTLLAHDETGVPDRWPITRGLIGSERFVIRHFYCPHCATQVDMEVALKSDGNPVRAIEFIA